MDLEYELSHAIALCYERTQLTTQLLGIRRGQVLVEFGKETQ